MPPSVALLLLVALSLPLVACAGSDTRTASVASVGDAVDETLAAGTARFTLTFEPTRDDPTLGLTKGEPDSYQGTVDFELHRNEIASSDPVIVDETTFYFQPAAEGDTQWRKYDLSPKPGDELAPDIFFGRLDVIRQLEYVASLEGSLQPAGEEDVGGVATTRYTGFGEAEALMRTLLSESLYGYLDWSTHSYSVERTEPIPFDVWVGEDGRVHKVVYDFPNFSTYAGDLTTIELHDFGADIDIELPEAVEG